MSLMEVKWIPGQGVSSNIFLIQSGVTLMIDAGSGMNFEHIGKKLEDFGISFDDIDVLVNTHCHFDHTGGDYEIVDSTDCVIMASEITGEALSSGNEDLILAGMMQGDLEPLEVSRTLQEGDKLEIGDKSLSILSTPGHTKGSISLYEPDDKLLFSGDAVFKGGIGRMDLPTASRKDMVNTLKKLKQIEIEKLYPGHGPIAEENAERYIDMASNLVS